MDRRAFLRNLGAGAAALAAGMVFDETLGIFVPRGPKIHAVPQGFARGIASTQIGIYSAEHGIYRAVKAEVSALKAEVSALVSRASWSVRYYTSDEITAATWLIEHK